MGCQYEISIFSCEVWRHWVLRLLGQLFFCLGYRYRQTLLFLIATQCCSLWINNTWKSVFLPIHYYTIKINRSWYPSEIHKYSSFPYSVIPPNKPIITCLSHPSLLPSGNFPDSGSNFATSSLLIEEGPESSSLIAWLRDTNICRRFSHDSDVVVGSKGRAVS